MTDAAAFSPLWGAWYLRELIGRGSFGAVYRAEKSEYGSTYISAVKHLSIPPDHLTKAAMAAEGMATDDESLRRYCDRMRDDIIREISFCYTLRGNTNIVSYEDHCIIPKKNAVGYDIFIRMELLTALPQYMAEHPMTEADVIRLGISLCEALELLRQRHMIHRDIKPANIFVNDLGVYKLGDFGESKVLSQHSIGMTVRGTYAYMSPEIFSGGQADITADIYSLGLVLYRLLNGGRAPFLPTDGSSAEASAVEAANIRRLRGEALPPPAFCRQPALAAVVLKACAYQPQERWRTPQEMRRALEALCGAAAVGPTAVPSYTVPPETVGYTAVSYGTAVPPAPSRKKKRLVIIGSIAAAAAVIGILLAVVLVLNGQRRPPADVSRPETVSAVSSVPDRAPSAQSSVLSEPSAPTSQNSAEELSVQAFLATPQGQAVQSMYTEQAQQQIDETMYGMMTFRMYTEGEDVLVYDYQYKTVDSITEAQKNLISSEMDKNRSTVQQEIRSFVAQYHVRPYQLIYRYRGRSGGILTELSVTL